MCGIVGATAQRDVAELLLVGLQRLEYRGYDSAGMAIIDPTQSIERLRTLGKVCELAQSFAKHPIPGHCGIAHTRWATHGEPAEHNAHPHVSNDRIAIVHNGIIENHHEWREKLKKEGYQFTSATDSEVIAHLLHLSLRNTDNVVEAFQNTVSDLQGAFALGILDQEKPDQLYAIRKGSPLVIGLGIGENYLASDQLALLSFTRKFIFLEDGDMAVLSPKFVQIYDAQGKAVERPVHQADASMESADKGEYRHFMQKEIFEQPKVIADTIESRISLDHVYPEAFGSKACAIFERVKAVQIVACGTSYHAGLIAKYWLEGLAGIPCQIEIASEYRYRKQAILPDTLFVTISQSGETADTLAALHAAKQKNYCATLAICNVPSSSLVRESDCVLMTRAGVEIGVASTKAFTTQLAALLLLTLALGQHHQLSDEVAKTIVMELHKLPDLVTAVLKTDDQIKLLAPRFADKNHTLFLGRGVHYPVALEGALKLKEISYIHAEAYPAGELKHGPLALIDNDMPVVAIAPNDELLEKLKSNLEVVRARGGQLFVFADQAIDIPSDEHITVMRVPSVSKHIAPIIYTIPLQLLAYHVAVIRGTDVDQPRNLAKSVTTE